MLPLAIATAVLVVLSTLIALVLQRAWSRKRRSVDGFWRRFWIRQLLLIPVHFCVVIPGALGYVGSRFVQTRGDESAYRGPIIDAQDTWVLQTRTSLADRPQGEATDELPPPTDAELAAIRRHRVFIKRPDGHRLRGFLVASSRAEPSAVVILTHGLFRGAMEIEPVAAMFRDLGAEVLLLELTNHGGSDHRPFTFGLREQGDVLAAVEYLRGREQGLGAPLVLYGVSLGSIAVSLAAPKIPDLAGLVLDAPMTDLEGTAHRYLGGGTGQGRRRTFSFPGFYIDLILWYVELWSGFDLDDVRPLDSYKLLPSDLPALCIGGGLDQTVPPDLVRQVFASLPAPDGVKELWIEPGSTHGGAWNDQPEQYKEHLRKLLVRVADGR